MVIHILPEERRQHIIDILADEGKLTVPDISRRLNVSVDTIRRDLKELEEGGNLSRVYGGALPKSPSTASYFERKNQNRSAKLAVAKKTAQLIRPGQVVFIDSGTTALEIACNMAPELSATVVTGSPPVAMALTSHAHIEVIVLPGVLDKRYMSVTGASTMEAVDRIQADVCIPGACSIHHEIGVATVNYDEAEIKRMMIRNSGEVIIAITADKIGTVAPFEVTKIENVTRLVTEATDRHETLIPYKQAGIEILKV